MKIVVCVALFIASAVFAFGDTRLRGTVTDDSGAAISGAMILIHWDPAGSAVGLRSNVGREKGLVLKTDLSGSFAAELPSGFYDLFVSAMAFAPACRKIRLNDIAPSEFRFRLVADPTVMKELGDRFPGKR